MWIWFSALSAILLGLYDVAKKQALKRNGVLWILLLATALSTLFLTPFFSSGSIEDHASLVIKALLVSSSWVSGMIALRLMPLTTVSTVKASRPMFVVIFSIILFGERLNVAQIVGVLLVFAALLLLGLLGKREGELKKSGKGIFWLAVSVITGSASALYDKHILSHLQPLFVQSWGNLYVTLILAILILGQFIKERKDFQGFKWDWNILLIAVFITISDALYFYAVKDEGALLSVISMIRRSSVVITFVFGAIAYKEKHIKDKSIQLALLLAGVGLLLFGS